MTSRNRLYFIINLTVFIDTLLYGIIVPAVPHYAETFDISETVVGTIFVAYSAGLLLSSVPVGHLCDRVDRKKILITGAIGLAVTTLIYMVSNSLYLILISRFLQGVASSAAWTAGMALVAEMFPSSSRGKKLGLILSAAGLGTIVGPALGGVLFEFLGYKYPFAIIAIIALAPIILLGKKNKEFLPEKNDEPDMQSSNLLATLKNRNLLWGAITISSATFGFGVIEPILPLQLEQRFGLTSLGIGFVFGILSLSVTLSQPIMGGLADKFGRKKMMAAGLLATAAVAPFLAYAQSLVLIGLIIFLFGLASGMISAPCLPLMAESISRNEADGGAVGNAMYGTAFGVLNTAYSFGLAAGPLLGGLMTENFSFVFTMGFYSVLVAAVSIGVMRNVWETLTFD
ncbi:MAG: MFS transporter [Thermincola sp.]|nr:MFS transporter [Thermincola sp.]MDT3702333.1 MFS transporter [Thermincola sp.]